MSQKNGFESNNRMVKVLRYVMLHYHPQPITVIYPQKYAKWRPSLKTFVCRSKPFLTGGLPSWRKTKCEGWFRFISFFWPCRPLQIKDTLYPACLPWNLPNQILLLRLFYQLQTSNITKHLSQSFLSQGFKRNSAFVIYLKSWKESLFYSVRINHEFILLKVLALHYQKWQHQVPEEYVIKTLRERYVWSRDLKGPLAFLATRVPRWVGREMNQILKH